MTFTTTHISDRITEIQETIHEGHWADDVTERLILYRGAVAMMTEIHTLWVRGEYWFSDEELSEMMRTNEEIMSAVQEGAEPDGDWYGALG